MFRLKEFWQKLTRPKSKHRKHTHKNGNNASAYGTLPYYYPTEQVNNNPGKKKKYRRY
jgi:hypothetical protein